MSAPAALRRALWPLLLIGIGATTAACTVGIDGLAVDPPGLIFVKAAVATVCGATTAFIAILMVIA